MYFLFGTARPCERSDETSIRKVLQSFEIGTEVDLSLFVNDNDSENNDVRVYSCYTLISKNSSVEGLSRQQCYVVITNKQDMSKDNVIHNYEESQVVELLPIKKTKHLWPFSTTSQNSSSSTTTASTTFSMNELSFKPDILLHEQLAKVTKIHPLSSLSKIRYKKGVSEGVLLMDFKDGTTSQYIMKNVGVFTEHVRQKMKETGLGSEVTKTENNEKFDLSASLCFERIKDLEKKFSCEPSFQLITDIMILFRNATEKFEEADNESYLEVTKYIRQFLGRNDVVSILNGQVQQEISLLESRINKINVKQKEKLQQELHEKILLSVKSFPGEDEDEDEDEQPCDLGYRSNSSQQTIDEELNLQRMLNDLSIELSDLLSDNRNLSDIEESDAISIQENNGSDYDASFFNHNNINLNTDQVEIESFPESELDFENDFLNLIEFQNLPQNKK